MKLWKKGILITSALLLAAGMMAGCGGEKQAASSASGKNVLKVATNATYVPFEFKTKDGKDYTGYENRRGQGGGKGNGPGCGV